MINMLSISSTWWRCCSPHDTFTDPENGGKDQELYREFLISLHLQSHDNFGTLVRERRSSWVLRRLKPRERVRASITGQFLSACSEGKSGGGAEDGTLLWMCPDRDGNP